MTDNSPVVNADFSSSSNNTSGTTPPACHPAFEWQRSKPIESLQLLVEEYRHKKTGAQHIHISTDNPENVFLVALRTVPEDSTGVAHILEHTALCGSEKYPVRDPFFMMIRRSLNTFMNAFTSSDWTAYPFASQNRKDFNNLLDVYLDAVFFSRLDPLDFAQEGHRVEFAETDNPDSDLVYKGVVFNEMKGAMSSITSTLWQTLSNHLYEKTTYHYNSGGEPENIPDLSYEQLLNFYKSHYHPSNAIFMTFGDIPAMEHQQKFEEQALCRFEKLDRIVSVDNEPRFEKPLSVSENYACDEESLENKTHVVMGWLLGESANLEKNLQAQLLGAVLLENSASPLQHALETTDLGTAPSPLCGIEDSQKEMLFVAGIEGSDSGSTDAAEKLILDAIIQVAKEGVSEERLAACLHQLELQQREIGGDGYPYGLQLILTCLNSATHRGDPIALLDLDPALEKLSSQIKDPEFIKQLAQELLLDNPHRVTLTLQPDNTLSGQRQQKEAERLALIKSELDEQAKKQIIEQAHALEERQQQDDDAGILPKVELTDIPDDIFVPEQLRDNSKLPLSYFNAGTNGLVYQQIIIPLPKLDTEELSLLPIYTACLTELGVGDKDYLQVQDWQSAVCGGISAFSSTRSELDDLSTVNGYFTLSAKSLNRNHKAICDLMQQTLENTRFDETGRIAELVAQIRARREMSITGNGHILAMTAASSGISPLANLNHTHGGLRGIQLIKQLDDSLKDSSKLQAFAEQLKALHQKILHMPRQFLLISDEHSVTELKQQLENSWQDMNNKGDGAGFFLPDTSHPVNDFWQTNTQVNFCARAYPTVGVSHADAPALSVLGGFLRNGFLHTSIREKGGAYGGGASQDSATGAFRFFSYRDPRMQETLTDFDQSIEWLLKEEHSFAQVEEAILGVIGTLDKPSSPAGEAKSTFHNNLFNRTPEHLKAFRSAVRAVQLEDLKRVGETYLVADKANTAVISNSDNVTTGEELGLQLIIL